MEKLRIWWIPQIPGPAFYKEIETVEEGAMLLDTLAQYDIFQFDNNIKGDYSNVGGLQIWDEEQGDWQDWFYESQELGYFDDPEQFILYKKENNID